MKPNRPVSPSLVALWVDEIERATLDIEDEEERLRRRLELFDLALESFLEGR